MTVAEDMTQIAKQETALVFPRFNEQVALDIGLALKALAEAQNIALAIDIRLWDRQLFFYSMAEGQPPTTPTGFAARATASSALDDPPIFSR